MIFARGDVATFAASAAVEGGAAALFEEALGWPAGADATAVVPWGAGAVAIAILAGAGTEAAGGSSEFAGMLDPFEFAAKAGPTGDAAVANVGTEATGPTV
jgi:hypothetical protein